MVRQCKYIAGLALKHAAHFLQRVEIHPESLAFLQSPQRRMADAGLFCQPIESPTLVCQYFIYSNFNNKVRPPSGRCYLLHAANSVGEVYILHVRYTHVQRLVVITRISKLLCCSIVMRQTAKGYEVMCGMRGAQESGLDRDLLGKMIAHSRPGATLS